MGRFHKALPNVKNAYVTLKDFTQDIQKIYTDISAISVILCNSEGGEWQEWQQKVCIDDNNDDNQVKNDERDDDDLKLSPAACDKSWSAFDLILFCWNNLNF